MNAGLQQFFHPRRSTRAITCAFAAVLLAHHPAANAQAAGATAAAPPLIVFTEYQAAASPSLLSAGGAATLKAIRSDPAASEIQIGRSAPAAVLRARALSFALPRAARVAKPAADATIIFANVSVEHNEDGLVSLYARDEQADSELSLVIDGADVLGSIWQGRDLYRMSPLGGGMTAVYRYDASRLREHSRSWDAEELRNRSHDPAESHRRSRASEALTDNGEVIDIMVAYTPKARREAGNIDALIQLAIDNTNRIWGNTDIRSRLRLVHKYETSYAEGTDMGVILRHFTYIGDDRMEEVHELRDRYRADLVSLIIGDNPGSCGRAWIASTARRGFSVVPQDCEAGNYSFAHEVGHNMGAEHDPDHSGLVSAFPFGHGLCNTDSNWRTVMSYSSNPRGSCRRRVPYFSSPIVTYDATPTGDVRVRDNRRVLNLTAYWVANFRQSGAAFHTIPFVPPASNAQQKGFVRIINRSDRAGAVQIEAFDDEGQHSGPVELSLNAKQTRQLNSEDLEQGNPWKGLSGGIGEGKGNWRLKLTTGLEIEALAYVRSRGGLVTGMHETAAETAEGSMHYRVPFFNPGRNRRQVSTLRLINPGEDIANVGITGLDDDGNAPPEGEVSLLLKGGTARTLTAQQLEKGHSGIEGRFGAGSGKWQLSISADRPILVMNLLHGRLTGNIVNVSPGGVDPDFSVPELPPGPAGPPDMVALSCWVTVSNPSPGQSFQANVLIRNLGFGVLPRATVQWYRSSDATISTGDTGIGSTVVAGGPRFDSEREQIGLTAPSSPGTWYFGACVDPVPGESDTSNNCSAAAKVMVQ